jgi:Crinkler effector protein N-terminal domain
LGGGCPLNLVPAPPPQSDIMSTTYTIFCVIMGEDNAFHVEIASSEIVDQLKKKIKEKRQIGLGGVDAAELALYHVEIPDNEDVAKAVEQELSEHPARLRPTEELAAVFKDGLKRRTVHIIVQPPHTGEFLRAGILDRSF